MRLTDPKQSERLVKELEPYASTMSFKEIADVAGCHPPQVRKWLYEGFMPSAMSFAGLDKLGVDVLYVITGRREAGKNER